MDANDNNNSNLSEISNVKRELLEDTASETSNNPGMINLQNIYSIVESTSNDFSVVGIKRRSSEEPKLLEISDEDNDSNDIVVKRPRFSDSECNESVSNSNNNMNNQSPKQSENKTYTMIVSTLSGRWTSQQIIDFLVSECDMNYSCINDNRNTNSETNIQIKLKFSEKAQLEQVFNKLKKLESATKLRVESEDIKQDEVREDNEMQAEDVESNKDENHPSSDVEAATDDNAFYIREDYLESLGIRMPITNWVTVTNFRCDKTELKEVLELAGKVLVCSVIVMNTKYANVMYSHPLEAIQAISMLNGQKLYGQSLKLTMNNSRDINMLLPKGLADVGPGLGKYGKSLPDVADQFKRFMNGQKSTIDAQLFQPELLRKIGIPVESRSFARSAPSSTSSNHDDASEHSDAASEGTSERNVAYGPRIIFATPVNPAQPMYLNRPINYIPPNPFVVRGANGPMVAPRAPISNPVAMEAPRHMPPPGPVSYCRSPISGEINRPRFQSSGPVPGPYIPQTRPPLNSPVGQIRGPVGNGPPNRFPSPNLGPSMSRGPCLGHNGPEVPPLRPYIVPQSTTSSNVQMFKGTDPVTIQISNLPPSTNFANLGQKLSELGHVVFLEFTTPGCAIVRFANPTDADRCLQNFRQVLA